MRNKIAALSLTIVLLCGGCANASPNLKGGYQSERTAGTGYTVLMSIDDSDSSFIEYIDGREVDRGTYEKIKDNRYDLKSDIQDFEIELADDNSFAIIVKKVNEGKTIQLKNVEDVPVVFTTKFDDVEKYKELLE